VTDNPAEPWLCALGPYATQYIKTPLFIMHSQYDAWQLQNIAGLNRTAIYDEQAGIGELKDEVVSFGEEWRESFKIFEGLNSSSHAAYVVSCVCHVYCGPNASTFFDKSEALQMYMAWYRTPAYRVEISDAEVNYNCASSDGTVKR